MVSGEVAAGCFKDSLDRERLMDWVMGVDVVKAVRNDVLDSGVEPIKERGVELIDGNSMACKEGGCNRQEASIVFKDISFVADTRLS